MDRRSYVLAVLAASDGAVHTPVQIQKLLFLLDRESPHLVGGPYFSFRPDDYGPFDVCVYDDLSSLAMSGDVEIIADHNIRWQKYRTAPLGQRKGETTLRMLPESVAQYIRQLSAWVRSLRFDELVTAIYSKYPEMRVNSVFR